MINPDSTHNQCELRGLLSPAPSTWEGHAQEPLEGLWLCGCGGAHGASRTAHPYFLFSEMSHFVSLHSPVGCKDSGPSTGRLSRVWEDT